MAGKRVFITDLDNTLLNMEERWIEWVESRFGLKVQPSTFVQWSIMSTLGLSVKDSRDMWSKVHKWPLNPYTGAGEFLSSLRKEGIEPVIVTSRTKLPAQEAAQAEINLHFPGTRFFFSDKKWEIANHLIATGHDIWGFLDDKPEHVHEMADRAAFPCFLWDKPWNQGMDLSQDIIRAKSYEEVVDRVMFESLGND